MRTPALSDFRFAPNFAANFPTQPETPAGPPPEGSFGPFQNPFATDAPDLQSETLRALEAGYRLQAAAALSFDLATYSSMK